MSHTRPAPQRSEAGLAALRLHRHDGAEVVAISLIEQARVPGACRRACSPRSPPCNATSLACATSASWAASTPGVQRVASASSSSRAIPRQTTASGPPPRCSAPTRVAARRSGRGRLARVPSPTRRRACRSWRGGRTCSTVRSWCSTVRGERPRPPRRRCERCSPAACLASRSSTTSAPLRTSKAWWTPSSPILGVTAVPVHLPYNDERGAHVIDLLEQRLVLERDNGERELRPVPAEAQEDRRSPPPPHRRRVRGARRVDPRCIHHRARRRRRRARACPPRSDDRAGLTHARGHVRFAASAPGRGPPPRCHRLVPPVTRGASSERRLERREGTRAVGLGDRWPTPEPGLAALASRSDGALPLQAAGEHVVPNGSTSRQSRHALLRRSAVGPRRRHGNRRPSRASSPRSDTGAPHRPRLDARRPPHVLREASRLGQGLSPGARAPVDAAPAEPGTAHCTVPDAALDPNRPSTVSSGEGLATPRVFQA